MLNGDEVLAQLKFDKDQNISIASKWSDEEIAAMMDVYSKTKSVAKETKNNSLYLIACEKIEQLQSAVSMKQYAKKQLKISSNQAAV